MDSNEPQKTEPTPEDRARAIKRAVQLNRAVEMARFERDLDNEEIAKAERDKVFEYLGWKPRRNHDH